MDVQAATTTHYCKFPDCPNEAASPVGRYAYCSEHQNRSGAAAQRRSGAAAQDRVTR